MQLRLIGITGIIVLFFGAVTAQLVETDRFYVITAHIVVGILLLIVYLFQGGLRSFRATVESKTVKSYLGSVFYGVLFIATLIVLNYLVKLRDPLHFDSTEQQVYTLAPETISIIHSLPDKVIIRAFYLGGVIPDVRLGNLLERLDDYSSKVELQIIDPDQRPMLAEKYGVNENATLHFAYANERLSLQSKISRNINEQTIANAIKKLSRASDKKVYFLVGHGEGDLDSDKEDGYLFFKEAIQGENLKVEPLSLAHRNKIPEDAAILILIAPSKKLAFSERKAILDYVDGGGHLMMFADPRRSDEIAKLAVNYGLDVGEDIIIEPLARIMGGAEMGVDILINTYVEHPIVNKFKNEQSVFHGSCSVRPSSVKPEEGDAQEIALSGDNSWAERDLAQVFSKQPQASKDKNDLPGPVPIAAVYENPKIGSRIVVFGDKDFITNLWIRRVFNRDFLLNALNWAIGEGKMVRFRAGTMRRSLKLLTEDEFTAMFLCSAMILPEIIIIAGFFVWWRRKN